MPDTVMQAIPYAVVADPGFPDVECNLAEGAELFLPFLLVGAATETAGGILKVSIQIDGGPLTPRWDTTPGTPSPFDFELELNETNLPVPGSHTLTIYAWEGGNLTTLPINFTVIA